MPATVQSDPPKRKYLPRRPKDVIAAEKAAKIAKSEAFQAKMAAKRKEEADFEAFHVFIGERWRTLEEAAAYIIARPEWKGATISEDEICYHLVLGGAEAHLRKPGVSDETWNVAAVARGVRRIR